MKKILALILALALVFTFASCGKKEPAQNDKETVKTESFVKPKDYASVLLVTINPQFRLYLDANSKVLAVEAVNKDAKSIEKNITFEDKNVEEVVKDIVNVANDKGFVKQDAQVKIEITETKLDENYKTEILDKTTKAVNEKATELKITVTVSSQDSTSTDTDTKTENNSSQQDSSSQQESSSQQQTPSTPSHTHSFSAANCTAPKKCACGATEGKALGHDYKNGVCTRCSAKDPNYTPSYTSITSKNGVWRAMITKGTKVYDTKLFFVGELKVSQPVWDEFSTIPEDMQKDVRENGDSESYMVYNGKEYYCGMGGYVPIKAPVINGDKVTVTIDDQDLPNATIVLKRTGENTLKVESFTENFTAVIDMFDGTEFTFSAK